MNVIRGKTYTVTGQDVYFAHRRGSMWLLENVNKSWRWRGGGLFSGYVIRNGIVWQGEYVWGRGGVRWQVKPAVVKADFKSVRALVKRIDLTE